MATTRLTRDEKKAQTRARLLEAARAVFARRGFAASSLDEVAEEAGLTKGAVYSNFANKEDLVLAVLEDSFNRRMDDIVSRVDMDAPLEEQARLGGALFMAISEEERWLDLLSLDFVTYAARNPEFNARLAARHRESLAAIADVITDASADGGRALPLPADKLALVMNALGAGLSQEQLIDPEAVPDELFGEVIALLWAGAGAGQSPGTSGTAPS
jgi:AcrR family transcriptional regulator